MAGFVRWIRRLIAELRRRRVLRVAGVYAGTAFVILQLGEILVEPFGLPGWTLRMVTFLLVLGFPLAVGLAWVYNITEEGLVRDVGEEDAGEIGPEGKPLTSNGVLVGLLVLIAGLLLYPRVFSSGEGSEGQPSASDTVQVEDRSIAVLPFENMGGKKSAQFTQGVHDDLLTRLSNVSDLKVISRTSVKRYRNTDLPLPAIADSLDVRWVVEGGVQRSGPKIKVNAQLIDPRNDINRWADSYQRDLSAKGLFAIQGEITREIAGALQARLTAEEEERVKRRPTGDLDAYRLYVQGRDLLAGRTFGHKAGWRIFKKLGDDQQSAGRQFQPSPPVQRAVGYFRRAIEQDSSFARAWAGLADAAAWYPSNVPDSASSLRVSQKAAARRALKLDPDLAEAHASMGFVHLANMDAPAALRELTRALELKPSYWEAHHWLGELYLKIGRPQQALNHLTLALELNPQHALARHWLYDAYLAAGRPEKSLREARRQQRLGLEQVNAVAGEIRALYHLDRLGEARRLAQEQLPKLDKGLWPVAMRGHLAAVLAAAGDTAAARKQVGWIRSNKEGGPFWVGFAYASVGKTDRAFDAWERMAENAWGLILAPGHLRYGILLDMTPLQDAPRYRELIREANRAWGLNPDGSIPERTDPSFDAEADA